MPCMYLHVFLSCHFSFLLFALISQQGLKNTWIYSHLLLFKAFTKCSSIKDLWYFLGSPLLCTYHTSVRLYFWLCCSKMMHRCHWTDKTLIFFQSRSLIFSTTDMFLVVLVNTHIYSKRFMKWNHQKGYQLYKSSETSVWVCLTHYKNMQKGLEIV